MYRCHWYIVYLFAMVYFDFKNVVWQNCRRKVYFLYCVYLYLCISEEMSVYFEVCFCSVVYYGHPLINESSCPRFSLCCGVSPCLLVGIDKISCGKKTIKLVRHESQHCSSVTEENLGEHFYHLPYSVLLLQNVYLPDILWGAEGFDQQQLITPPPPKVKLTPTALKRTPKSLSWDR